MAATLGSYAGVTASFATGLGEAAVVIGVFGFFGESIYDYTNQGIQYMSQKEVEFNNWIKSIGKNKSFR